MKGKISAIAAGIVTAGIITLSPASAETTFKDVDDDFWSKKQITYLSEQGVINGYPDGTFKPGREITRHQVAGMMVKALDLELKNRPNPNFSDVNESSTNYKSIAAVADEGIIRGSNGEFRPGETVTRAQMAAIITRAFGLERTSELQFIDVDHDYWTFSDISTITEHRITSGYPDGTFKPSNPTTRAQFSVFLARAMDEEQRHEYVRPGVAPRGAEIDVGTVSFRNEGNRIVRIEENGEETVIMDEEDFEGDYTGKDNYGSAPGLWDKSNLQFHNGWLYYVINSQEADAGTAYANVLYKVKPDGSEKTKLFGGLYSNFYIIGDKVYFLDASYNHSEPVNFVRSRLDGHNKVTLKSLDFRTLEMLPALNGGDRFEFYIDGNVAAYGYNGDIYKMNINGTNNTKLYDGDYNTFYFQDGKIIVETKDGETKEFDK